ncbi:MAG: metal-dependent transcriptional regulator [Gaiellaceae bacterium]
MAQGHSFDEYLETIYFLAFPIGEYRPHAAESAPLASRVAEMLGVSRASAGEMLKRLESEGLVERGERREALLTEAGRHRAEAAVRKHRIIERLLTDFMGYSPAEAHVHADPLGDSFDEEMAERTWERLERPQRCPHGWPIDTGFEQEENRELAPLADLEPGARATIVRLAEHDGELLHWFYEEELVPGRTLELRHADARRGELIVATTGREHAVSARAAAGLFVRRDGP